MNIKLIERIDAKFNPIMVKEIYQGFRGSWFVIGYGLALLISLGGYITIVLPASPQDESLSLGLFQVLSLSMTLVALFIIPVSAGNQLRNEITSNTLDLIAVTNLSPWAIVSGRFQAAVLKILLLFAYMGPFAIAALLLGGIGITLILFTLGFLLLFALGFCALLLMVNALPALSPRYKILATSTQILLLLFILFLFTANPFSAIGFTSSRGYGPFFNYADIMSMTWDWNVILGVMYFILIALLVMVFFLRLAADMLTPVKIRTSLYSKWVLTVILIVMCLPFSENLLFPTGSKLSENLLIVVLSTLCFFALFWGGQVNTDSQKNLMPPPHRMEESYTLTLIFVTLVILSLFLTGAISREKTLLPLFVILLMLSFLSLGKNRLDPYQKNLKPPCRLEEAYMLTLIYVTMLTLGLFLVGLLNWENMILLCFVTLLVLCLLILSLRRYRESRTQPYSIRHYLLGNGYMPTLFYVILLTFCISILVSVSQSSTKFLWIGLYFITYYIFFSGLARLLRGRMIAKKRTSFVYIVFLLTLIVFNGMATLILSTITGVSLISKYSYYNLNYYLNIFNNYMFIWFILVFLPFVAFSWHLTPYMGLWMLFPLMIGLIAAWLGKEKSTEECKVNLHDTCQ